MSDTEIDPWTRYWNDGRIASCYDPGRGKYMPTVAALWTDFFNGLSSGAKVLDLCTGNGALLYIGMDTRGDLALVGVDKARIDPAANVTSVPAIHATFKGEIDASALPYKDGVFDAVISQYGLEYAPRPEALSEALRVLAPGGHFRVLTHAKEGIVAKSTSGQLRQTNALLESDFFQQTRAAISAGKRNAPGADALTQIFHRTGQKLFQLSSEIEPNEILSHTLDVIGHAWQSGKHVDEQTLIAKVNELEAETDAHAFRSRALFDSALTEAEAKEWSETLKGAGLLDVNVRAARIPDPDRHIGWIIEGRRV